MLPNGDTSVVNEAGLQYYDNLINELLVNGIESMVTIYHWDMPMHLQNMGGMSNPLIVDHFASYADLLFQRFGDRVSYWITFNEPLRFCSALDYQSTFPFFTEVVAANNYLCAHHMLLAHAKVYALYHREYSYFKGRLGISLDAGFAYPHNPDSLSDVEAANRAMQFFV